MKFYKRPLDSFADEIITHCRPNKAGDLWYAVLDVGPKAWVSDPDYSTCRDSHDKAVRDCAATIRARLPTLMGRYDIDWRLKRHWANKEAALLLCKLGESV